MPQRLAVTIKSTIFERHKALVIDPGYLEFDNWERIDPTPSRFEKEEIYGIRYGIRPIKGYYFNIGRIYCVDIQNESGKIIKLRLKSLYGIRKKLLGEKYSRIVHALFDNYYSEVINNYLNLFNNQLSFEILGVIFTTEGIFLKKNDPIILWSDLGTKDYISYYALFSEKTTGYYKAFQYLEDWNTAILYSVSRQILRNKNLWKN